MSDHPQAEKLFAIGDRRLHTRTPVTPQAFVKFGAQNYGFVFNISENGLVFAPTGILALAVGAVARMRFQLPKSQEWVETSGEVAWIAESKREAGVRFVDLTEDARVKIRKWISQEPYRPDLPEAHDSVRDAIGDSQPSTRGVVPEDKILKSIFADPGLFLVDSKSARTKPAPELRPVVAEETQQNTSSSHIPERRSQPRRRVMSLEYLDLGDSNGGIIVNLGEDGMYIQAVASLSPDRVTNLSFRIPDSGYPIETSGNIVWVGESKKDAGIQFDNLPKEARLKIREWVAAEFPSRQDFRQLQQPAIPDQSVAKPAPDARQHERLGEMPPGVAPKSPANASNSAVVFASDQRADFAQKSPTIAIAPPNLPFSNLPSKEPDFAGKLPNATGELVDSVAQKSTGVPVNRIPLKQSESVGESSRIDASAHIAHKPADARKADSNIQKPPTIEPPLVNVAQPRSGRRGALPLGTFTGGTAAPALGAPEPSEPGNSSFSLAATPSVGWKRAVAVSIVVLISFAAGWILAGPNGRKQIFDKFSTQQTDSLQPPENRGATSAQTDAPVPGAGLSQTEPSTTGSTERITAPPPPQLAPQTPRPTPASAATGNVPASAQEKLSASKRDERVAPSPLPSSASNAANANNRPQQPPASVPPLARTASPAAATPAAAGSSNASRSANSGTAPPAALANSSSIPPSNSSRDSRTIQPTSTSSAPASSPSSASNTRQPQAAQPTSAGASSASNPPSSTAKTAPLPASANSSSPPPNANSSPAHTSVPAAEVVKGTVSVNASPFPSIRVPPELKSQISKQGASLQIGLLISRVDPIYPEDAQHQRIEGVVKLRAIIARDGRIQDIDQMSGPPLLVAAAANAVRQWRYKPTSLDGQPIEATETITVTFRLQSVPTN